MPYRICKTIEIESGHMLAKHPDKCRFPHGHSRRVEIIIEADDLDGNGMVCDFKAVKLAAGEFLERFDHALCVNTADPMFETLRAAYGDRIIPFEGMEPTTEALAKVFFDEIGKALDAAAREVNSAYPVRPSIRLRRVRVWETSSSWAEWEA